MRWLFFVSPPSDGVFNMALDEALLVRSERTGDAVFRVYGWSTPTVSLGRNQRARGFYDEDRARALGVSFVRRPTGGRALLHHREVTYSVAMPVQGAAGARQAYDFINDVLLGGLARLGVSASRATGTMSVTPGPRPCFDVPAENEIAFEGRKLIGSAQWRRGGALLQHGSILVRDDQHMIARLLRVPLAAETPSAATLAAALGWEPSIQQVAQPILDALSLATHRHVEPYDAADAVREALGLQSFYHDDAWTWRR